MDVFDDCLFGIGYCSPPKVMFIPDKKTLRTLVKAVLKYGHEPPHVFYLRFGIVGRDILDKTDEAFDLPIEVVEVEDEIDEEVAIEEE
jgi:hypothetical protein